MGVAFLLFLPFADGGPNSTPLLWIVLILFVFMVAELLLSRSCWAPRCGSGASPCCA